MDSTHEQSRRSQVIRYAVALTVIGLLAFVVTLTATGSLWWALLALFLAGPIGRALLGAVGMDPGPPATKGGGPR